MPEGSPALYTGKYLAEGDESVQSVTPTFLLRYVASRILAGLLIAISELQTKAFSSRLTRTLYLLSFAQS